MKAFVAALSAGGASLGCGAMAVATAPAKEAVHDGSLETRRAEDLFWDTLHAGRYEDIQPALEALTARYLAEPRDATTAAHIAFLHVWRLNERARQARMAPTITDDLALARRYFDEAVRLDPGDARLRGFLAGMTLAEGAVHRDEKLTRRGFYAMNDAVDAWPEFNLFTRGYVMSRLPAEDPRYASALEDQWRNLDACAGTRIDRRHPDYAPFMGLETHQGPKRACWNSWIAPHNFEGFFLNIGDMLVKAGDPATAKAIYVQARLSKDYARWPFREVLERRIADADANVTAFRRPDAAGDGKARVMFESSFGCMGCHQGSD